MYDKPVKIKQFSVVQKNLRILQQAPQTEHTQHNVSLVLEILTVPTENDCVRIGSLCLLSI